MPTLYDATLELKSDQHEQYSCCRERRSVLRWNFTNHCVNIHCCVKVLMMKRHESWNYAHWGKMLYNRVFYVLIISRARFNSCFEHGELPAQHKNNYWHSEWMNFYLYNIHVDLVSFVVLTMKFFLELNTCSTNHYFFSSFVSAKFGDRGLIHLSTMIEKFDDNDAWLVRRLNSVLTLF